MRWLALILALCLLAPTAQAEEASGSNKAAAEALFMEGRNLMSEGRHEEAIAKLKASQKLDPGIGTLLNLAECYERTGRIASAWAEYRAVISLARVAGYKERENLATERAQALEPKLSRLAISVAAPQDPASLTILRDGQRLDPAELGVPLPVDPGRHVIEASAPGKAPFSTEIEIGAEADSKSVEIPLLGDAAAGPATSSAVDTGAASSGSTQRTIALIVGGVGVVGVAMGAVFGVQASSDWSDAKAECSDYPFECTPEGTRLADDASGKATLSTVAFIVGGVGIAGGAVLWFTADSGSEAPVTVGLGPGSVRLKGSF